PNPAQQPKLAAEAQKVVDEDAKDDVAAGALVWLAQFGPPDKAEGVFKLLGEHHLASPRLAAACKALVNRPVAPEKFLRDVIAKSPGAEAKGYARFALAGLLHSQADEGEGDAKAKNAEAATLLEQVVREDANLPLPAPQKGTLATAAKPVLFEITHLAV